LEAGDELNGKLSDKELGGYAMKDKNKFSINLLCGEKNIHLRSASIVDLEYLRNWKNSERKYFFHQSVIEVEQQRSWFDSFYHRPNDYMLILDIDGASIGCMGIRLLSHNEWDVYNVILGVASFGKQGCMGRALTAMLQMARSENDFPIKLKVLKSNPALNWYQKNGFNIEYEEIDHLGLRYQNKTSKEFQS